MTASEQGVFGDSTAADDLVSDPPRISGEWQRTVFYIASRHHGVDSLGFPERQVYVRQEEIGGRWDRKLSLTRCVSAWQQRRCGGCACDPLSGSCLSVSEWSRSERKVRWCYCVTRSALFNELVTFYKGF